MTPINWTRNDVILASNVNTNVFVIIVTYTKRERKREREKWSCRMVSKHYIHAWHGNVFEEEVGNKCEREAGGKQRKTVMSWRAAFQTTPRRQQTETIGSWSTLVLLLWPKQTKMKSSRLLRSFTQFEEWYGQNVRRVRLIQLAPFNQFAKKRLFFFVGFYFYWFFTDFFSDVLTSSSV